MPHASGWCLASLAASSSAGVHGGLHSLCGCTHELCQAFEPTPIVGILHPDDLVEEVPRKAWANASTFATSCRSSSTAFADIENHEMPPRKMAIVLFKHAHRELAHAHSALASHWTSPTLAVDTENGAGLRGENRRGSGQREHTAGARRDLARATEKPR